MKILITGVAGFIGYNLSEKLLKNNNIVGIDNLNNYYSTTLKKERLKLLKKSKNFSFYKIDITNKNLMKKFLNKYKFDYVIHLAAQVGVRYCETFPNKYVETNIVGFFNLLNNLNYSKLKKIIYASSSSVYGDKQKFPINEKETLNPKNIYGLSKKFNEELADLYSNKTDMIGLRLFTVYGDWGRPDMFFLKILKSISNRKKFFLHNNGNHYRDFTYINDVVNVVNKLIFKKSISRHTILNICSSNPISVLKLVNKIEKFFGKSNISKIPLNNLEMIKTHGSNKKLRKLTNYNNFFSIDSGLKKTIKWYKTYSNKIKF